MAIRILLMDNQPVVRAGLHNFIQCDAELEVVGEAYDERDALLQARDLCPDVIIMDIQGAKNDSIASINAILQEMPKTQVIIFTQELDPSMVSRALRAGATGYLLKDAQNIDIVTAIKMVVAGQIYLAPRASATLRSEFRRREPLEPLTEREKEVWQLLAQGYSDKEIARNMCVSWNTVRTHVHHILSKLGVRSRTQASLIAVNLGLHQQWNDGLPDYPLRSC